MTKSEILSQLANGKISVEEAGVALEATESGARLYCKVSSKGGMSLYGLQADAGHALCGAMGAAARLRRRPPRVPARA